MNDPDDEQHRSERVSVLGRYKAGGAGSDNQPRPDRSVRGPDARAGTALSRRTALHKLHLPRALRYSEDIDLVRTTAGPILGRIRELLEPWLGRATFDQSNIAPKLRFRVPAEDGSGDIRLKLEINSLEIEAFDPPQAIRFSVENPWKTALRIPALKSDL